MFSKLLLSCQPKSSLNCLFSSQFRYKTLIGSLKSSGNKSRPHTTMRNLMNDQKGSQYTSFSYKVGNLAWFILEHFSDAIKATKLSKKLSARSYGSPRVLGLIGKNSIHIEIPDNVRAHPVVNFDHTLHYYTQPTAVSKPTAPQPAPVPNENLSLSFKISSRTAGEARGTSFSLCWRGHLCVKPRCSRQGILSLPTERKPKPSFTTFVSMD